MEPGGRKLLPRVHPSAEREPGGAVAEPTRNGTAVAEAAGGSVPAVWKSPRDEEQGPKRKRQHVEESSQSQSLPSLRQILTTPSRGHAMEVERPGPARLGRITQSTYVLDNFRFLAPYPSRDFPTSILGDDRALSFAVVEPELMDVFRRTWYLRHYIRLKRLQGEHWLDHIFFNDSFGIENVLYTWTSRYEPGTLQYPASMLYKHCLWLFFNRSIQLSQPSPAFTQVIEDGLHTLHTIENALGASGDRSILLIPLFLLGVSAFYPAHKQEVWDALERLEVSVSAESLSHAVRSIERIWGMMEDGHVGATWDWERYQAHDSIMATGDHSLIDLLWDPLLPPQPPRPRSPEAPEFDPNRFRAAQNQPPPVQQQQSQDSMPSHREDGEMYTPPSTRTPARNHSTASAEASDSVRVDGNQESQQTQEMSSGPRPFLAPPLPTGNLNFQPNSDVIQVMQRKSSKAKSAVPPCPTCGKELKNPSDAQKHQLQHSKPFRCREPGCTRTQGFATENDLQRHRKSVHGASPRIGNKIGYICAACPDPTDGTARKWWPRLDNFKAHIRRKHADQEEESLITASASARRPGDEIYSETVHVASSLRWPEERRHDQNMREDESSMDHTQYENTNRSEDSDPSRSPKSEAESDLSAAEGEGEGEADEDPMDVTTPPAKEESEL